jgi:hypothetical protein
MVDSPADVTQENTDVKLAIITQKVAQTFGRLARRMPHLEDVYPIPFEIGAPCGIYLIPKTASVDCTQIDLREGAEKMRRMIAAFEKTRERMPVAAFTDIREDMQDDLRVLEQFGKEESGGKEEERLGA